MTTNAFLNYPVLFLNIYSSAVLGMHSQKRITDLFYIFQLEQWFLNFQTSQIDNSFNGGGEWFTEGCI